MLFRAYHLIIDSDIDLKLPIVVDQTADVVFKAGKCSLQAKYKTKIYRRGIIAKTASAEHRILLHWPDVADFEAVDGKAIIYDKHTADDDIFRLFALSEVVGLLLFQRGHLLLHGSAVQVNKEGIIFTGMAGTGKSTTVAAFAKNDFTVLSDDLTAITFDEENKAVIVPAFPQIKIWEDAVEQLGFDKSQLEPAYEGHNKFSLYQAEKKFPLQPIPLKQIYILQRPFSRKKGAVQPTAVPIRLTEYFPLAHQLLEGINLQKHFMNSIKIAGEVPVINLPRPKDFAALQRFVNTYR